MSTVAFVFGVLSIPLAFARHLVSLALVVSVLGLAFGLWGMRQRDRHLLTYTTVSGRRATWGARAAAIGLLCSVVMWVLWASNLLF